MNSIPLGLRPMLEEFVRSVVSSRIKSRDLYKYAHEYFHRHDLSTKKIDATAEQQDDVMDDETEEQMRLAFDQLDDEETRRRTRPTLFGNTFNPEIEEANLSKTPEEKSAEEQHFLQQSIRKTIPFRALDADQIEEIIQYFQFYPVKSGEIIMKEKDEGDYFYLIQTGVFEALIDGEQVKLCQSQASSRNGHDLFVSAQRRSKRRFIRGIGFALRSAAFGDDSSVDGREIVANESRHVLESGAFRRLREASLPFRRVETLSNAREHDDERNVGRRRCVEMRRISTRRHDHSRRRSGRRE